MLGASIRDHRKAAGLTQAEFANTLGVKQAAVAMWESDKSVPRTDALPLIAKTLGCTIDQLFCEKEETT